MAVGPILLGSAPEKTVRHCLRGISIGCSPFKRKQSLDGGFRVVCEYLEIAGTGIRRALIAVANTHFTQLNFGCDVYNRLLGM